jgi:hypothetical protein
MELQEYRPIPDVWRGGEYNILYATSAIIVCTE